MLPSIKTHWRSLLAFFVLIIVIQVAGSATTFPSIQSWYMNLNRPSWSPPNWLFGPVWTILYAMLAICGWSLWNKSRQKPVMVCYFAQLFFNALWSPLFFGMHQPLIALIDLMLVFGFAGATLFLARKNNPEVTTMFVPYCLWLAYALSLNAAIVVLN